MGVTLRTNDGHSAQVKSGQYPVTVVGDPMELLLFVFGRDAAHVTLEGDSAGITRLRSADLGI